MAHTVRDIVTHLGDPNLVRKLVLVEDAMSPVPSFEPQEQQFLGDMRALGMRSTTTTQFLATA